MSYFLQNLIDRHQESGVSLEASHKVQPRLKARFEAERGSAFFAQNELAGNSDFMQATPSVSDTGLSLTRSSQDIGRLVAGERTPPARQTAVSMQYSTCEPAIQPDDSHRFDALNDRIEAVTFKLGSPSAGREKPIGPTEKQYGKQPDESREFLSSKPPTDRQLSLSDDINQRIQTILHRLNNQPSQGLDDQRANESQRKQASSNIEAQRTEDRAGPDELIQSGLLQIPGWLTEMQADLNERWREMNTRAEPMVNVTIGRVEVRATQKDSVKQLKTRNKPSGVMSLDDYLKQRENRGQG